MDIKPHLIIDIRDRSIFSLLVDKSGNSHPCTHNVSEYSLRYFFGEVLLDLQTDEDLTTKQRQELLTTFDTDKYDIIQVGKQLGWLWPYQWEAARAAVPIKHPLKVLSSQLPADNQELVRWTLKTSYALLEFLLEPLFHCIKSMGVEISEINATVIIPGYFNRRAQLILHKLLRRHKVQNVMIVNREIAATMARLEESDGETTVVLDMEHEDTHLHHIDVSRSTNEVLYSSTHQATLKDSGWRSMVKQFSDSLFREKLMDKDAIVKLSYLDKALLAIVFGLIPPAVPSNSNLSISHNLFDQYFVQSKRKAPKKYISSMQDWVLQTTGKNDAIIPLGLPFMIGQMENRMLEKLKNRQSSPGSMVHRALERPAYGMAAGLNWLRQTPGRKIKALNNAGFRVVTQPGESIELVPPAALPHKPGEHRTIRQALAFHLDAKEKKDVLHFHLLWGMNTNPKYNIDVCLLPIKVTQPDFQENRKIEVTLDLQRAQSGGGLNGSLALQFGDQKENASFRIANDAMEISTNDII